MSAGSMVSALLVSPCFAQAAAPQGALQAASQVTVARPRAVAQPKPFARLSASAHSLRDSIVALTRRQLGVKYRRGEESPDRGFDCSGLVKYVMEHFGADVPRVARDQALVGTRIERNIASLKPGDLLTFGHGKRVSHIGIYIGNGRYVHAPTPGARVREASLSDVKPGWWKGARRLFAFDDALSTDSLAN